MSINKKLDNEVKVLRDPVHEYIHIYDELIWNLIDTKEVQRLRRIHQLGGTYQVYHGAEHSRFIHSLGVYEIVRRMVEEVKGLKAQLSSQERLAVLCAALLHDVGHGPFSHAFEHISHVNHELMTIEIIQSPTTEINQVLQSEGQSFIDLVCSIINHTCPKKLLTQLVSAQLDADRMDYLLRDSYYTGVSYGAFDIERILRTLRVKEDNLVVKASGIHAVEDYIMARYQMYWQVYFHPTTRSFEMMLVKLFDLLDEVYQTDPEFIRRYVPFFESFLSHQVTVDALLFLDEQTMIHGFKMLMSQTENAVVQDFAGRLVNRDLFDALDYTKQRYDQIKLKLEQQGYDPRFYLGVDQPKQIPYIPYKVKSKENDILVLLNDGDVKEISEVSNIVAAMTEAKLKEDKRIFTIKELI